MFSDPKWVEICKPESTHPLDPDAFCFESSPPGTSPIDDYYDYIGHLMTLGDEPSLDDSEVLGRLLLLGLVSGVEQYFRSVIAGVLRACPESRRAAADQVIHFGAIDHYGPDGVEAALFDAASLADTDNIRKRTHKLLGIHIQDNTSVSAALREFEKVCVMRHAAVHSRGTLGRGNVRDLSIETPEGATMVLHLTFATLQQAGAACHDVVRAYNRFLFRELVERWGSNGSLSWNWQDDKKPFSQLADLFQSTTDGTGPRRHYDRYRSVRSTFAGSAI